VELPARTRHLPCASRTGTALRIRNGAVAAARSSFSPLPIQAPSRRPSSEPQSPWASFADQNGVMQEGSGGAAITNVRIRDGRRLNIPSSYLYPVMDQANLTALTGAYVNRLTIEGNTVTGVEFEWQNGVRRIKASSEVVLSAGAIQTPKIPMLSGIGDRAELDRFGIANVSALAGRWPKLPRSPDHRWRTMGGPGPLPTRNNASEANLFVKSRPELNTPDLHIWKPRLSGRARPGLMDQTFSTACRPVTSKLPDLCGVGTEAGKLLRTAPASPVPDRTAPAIVELFGRANRRLLLPHTVP
jgi:GMC oxidoreductase